MSRLFILTLITLSFLFGCGTDDFPGETNNYDQSSFLSNTGNIGLQALYNLKNHTDTLGISASDFQNDPTSSSLSDFRTDLYNARLAWQWVQPFAFGPSESRGLTGNLNIYPVDVLQIENNIANQNYDLNTLSNLDAKGFPAIEYLIYGEPGTTDEAIIASFESTDRANYLSEVISLIIATVDQVHGDWESNYIIEFRGDGSEGIDVGSGTSLLVNALNRTFERETRDGKLGIPIGVRSLGTPIPTSQEGYHSNHSFAFLKESVQAYRAIYEGIGQDGNDGEGLYEYLKSITSEDLGNQGLPDTIRNQFNQIQELVNLQTSTLTAAIEQDPSSLELIFVEMQRLVVSMKSDMASVMGITIVYQDNDGD
ncbi:MAG: imelysin family protein [Cyclobacteriaceae bacterium]